MVGKQMQIYLRGGQKNAREYYPLTVYYYNKYHHLLQVIDTFTQASGLLQYITSWMMTETLRRHHASCHFVPTGSQ